LEARLGPLGARMAVEVSEQIATGTAQGVKQDKSQATKAPKLKKEDGLIDWNRTHEQVCQQVRAMQPWPTAYTFLHRAGQPPLRLMIVRTGTGVVVPADPAPPAPGAFLNLGGADCLFVATGGPGAGAGLELQPAGRERMRAA